MTDKKITAKPNNLNDLLKSYEGKKINCIKDVNNCYWLDRIIKSVAIDYIVFEDDDTKDYVILPIRSIRYIRVQNAEKQYERVKGFWG